LGEYPVEAECFFLKVLPIFEKVIETAADPKHLNITTKPVEMESFGHTEKSHQNDINAPPGFCNCLALLSFHT
jgi:hypothetical protein